VPNPVDRERRRASRVVLSGDVPSPIDPPSGCRFHPRCTYARVDCATRAPTLDDIVKSVHGVAESAQNGAVACHYWREI